ncbi:MarR family winged helix-turn-helix transcriptional regulator [Halalkalibacter kiskunsagensis]|uniref:MarR family winged helix-turn-helix transcriptional regulator n=1 Tax=Halalkalibacter kiskunsagensis TaxID=1548599 RepID=A0ABV6KJG8_9BACI
MTQSKDLFAKSYLAFAFIRGLNFAIENDIKKQLDQVSFPSFRILWILYFDPNITMTELTYLAQTNISNVFRQLTKLKDEGFVYINNGNDARTKELTLTEKGHKFVHNFIKENNAHPHLQITNLLERIPADDLGTFLKVASLLSSELIGKPFSDWATKSANDM